MTAGYVKEMQTKVVRTTHMVSFHEGQTAETLLASLHHVPKNAKIVEHSDGDSETGEWPWIRFNDEKTDAADAPKP